MLYSEEYLEIQKKLHKNAGYGMSAGKHSDLVKNSGYKDILDYGCGKCSLQYGLGFAINNYDPAIERYKDNNHPHDFVYCGDVLEHIEPDCLDAVLLDIKRCAKKSALLIISTRPAKRILPDGRNAHLIVKDAEWWHNKLSEFFDIKKQRVVNGEYLAWV
jgi:hypothetical protein